MSGRIRTIKPELLEDERVAHLSHAAFRLFIGLILEADDYGNFRANPDQLRGSIFWGCAPDVVGAPTDVDALLVELARLEEDGSPGLIALYRAKGQRYGHLSGWAKHQRVHHPGLPRVPGPKDGETIDVSAKPGVPPETSRESPEPLRPDPIRSDPIRSDHRSSSGGQGEGKKPSGRGKDPSDVEVIFAYYAEARRRATGTGVLVKLTEPRAKMIRARLKEGYSVEVLKAAVRGLLASDFHMGQNDRGTKYIDPEHVFREAKQVERLSEVGADLRDPEPEPGPIEGVVTDPTALAKIRADIGERMRIAQSNLFGEGPETDETGPSGAAAGGRTSPADSDVGTEPPNGPGSNVAGGTA